VAEEIQRHVELLSGGRLPNGHGTRCRVAGRACVVAAGRDDTATMYAEYELLKRLCVVFQLTGDIAPERKATLPLPGLDVTVAPARKFRGVHVCHAYTGHMGMHDYRRLIDQIATMKD